MKIARLLPAAALGGFAITAAAYAAPANVESRLQENWRADIANTPAPAEGCFKAEYPSKTWQAVSCVKAPRIAFIPRHVTSTAGSQTVGNGNDYAAAAHGLITAATGSFHNITGLKTETDARQHLLATAELQLHQRQRGLQHIQQPHQLPQLGTIRLLEQQQRFLHPILADQLRQ